MGAINGSRFYKYELETKAGKLNITTHEPEASKVFSLYCSFDEADKAKQLIKENRLNRYSGKWNFHYWSADEVISRFKTEIEPILLT